MSTFTSDDRNRNESGNEPLDAVVDRYLSRRSVMKGGLGAAIAMIAGGGLTACFDGGGGSHDDPAPSQPAPAPQLKLGFESIRGARLDAIVLASGYSARTLAPWAPR